MSFLSGHHLNVPDYMKIFPLITDSPFDAIHGDAVRCVFPDLVNRQQRGPGDAQDRLDYLQAIDAAAYLQANRACHEPPRMC